MKTWYSITAKGEASAEIAIFGPIGNTWDGEGVTAAKFIADLKAIKAPAITLSVNSPGGSLFDGLAIYNALAQSGKAITGKVMGVAASAASIVLMACSKIVMPKNSHMMVHKGSNIVYGNADEMREMANVLDTLDASIAATYSARTGKPVDEIKAMLDSGDTWLTADQAVEMGFADEATDLVTVAAQFDLDQLPESVRAALTPPKPAPQAAALADQIKAAVEAAGLGDHLAVFALDPSLATLEQAQAAIGQAREVKQLASLVGKPEMAASLISARKTWAEAQAALAGALAAEDEEKPVDNKPAATNKPAPATDNSGPVAFWSHKAA